MWECPITTYMSEIINQQMVERENAITLKVSETIGVDVNREELIKALNYDRHQYEKGYADAKAEYESKWTKIEDGLPEENHAVVVYCPEWNNTYIASLHWNEDEDGKWYCWYYYTQGASRKITEEVVAWMPIPKYEGVSE